MKAILLCTISAITLFISATTLFCQKSENDTNFETVRKSRSGLKIAYNSAKSLWAIGPFIAGEKKVADNFGGIGLAWSPNGEYLAYSSTDTTFILGSDWSIKARLPVAATSLLAWSHASDALVLSRYFDGIYLYSTVTNSLKRLVYSNDREYDHNPVFSLNDSLIAYICHEHGTNAWIKIFSLDGLRFRAGTDMFLTGHDEELGLTWISNSEIMYKVGYSVFVARLKPGSAQAEITRVIDGTQVINRVWKFRVSPDHRLYAVSTIRGIKINSIGHWDPGLINDDWNVSDFTWTPGSRGLIYVVYNKGIYCQSYQSSSKYLLVPARPGFFWVTTPSGDVW